jgi:hypothetical protein
VNAQWVGSRTQEMNNPELSESMDGETFDGGKHTATLDGENYGGSAMNLEFVRDSRHWFYEVEYLQHSPTFRTENGFIRQNDLREFSIFQGYAIYPKGLAFVDRIVPRASAGRNWNFDGLRKSDFLFGGVFVQMKGQTNAFFGYEVERELFQGLEFTGLRSFDMFVGSNFSEPVQLGIELSSGQAIARNIDEPEVGKSFDLSAFGTFRPTDRLSLQPQFNYSQLVDQDTDEAFFSGYIVRLRLNYQFSRRFFLRTVVQYNDFAERLEVDPLLTYRINPFTAFYVGSTHDYDTFPGRTQDASRFLHQSQRQFFFKFQYLLRT